LKNNVTWSFELLLVLVGARIAQSLQQQAMGWMGVVQFLARARDFSLLHRVQTRSAAHPASYQMGMVQFPARARDFSLLHRVQTRSAAHPASYQIGIRGSFPRGKAVRV
jgi:hypothetical protein